MHKTLLSAALVLSAVLPAQAADNLLLGNWKLAAGSPDGCYSPIAFTAATQSLTMKGQVNKTNVTYNVSPGVVYVIGNTGISGAVRYDILDRSHIKLHSWAECSWTRQ